MEKHIKNTGEQEQQGVNTSGSAVEESNDNHQLVATKEPLEQKSFPKEPGNKKFPTYEGL